MKRRKLYLAIFSPILLAVLIMYYYEGSDILNKHYMREKVADTDVKVVKKLKKIREAQKAYFAVNREYADNWGDLIEFIREGEFPIIVATERLFEDRYGEDSAVVRVDTLDLVPVFDSLQTALGYNSKDEVSALPRVPMGDTIFTLYANVFEDDNSTFHSVEVADPKPFNPRRQEGGDMDPLKFGSKGHATLKGNWE